MSIKAKLLFLISSILSSFILIAGGYFMALKPIAKMEKETIVIKVLMDSILKELLILNQVWHSPDSVDTLS